MSRVTSRVVSALALRNATAAATWFFSGYVQIPPRSIVVVVSPEQPRFLSGRPARSCGPLEDRARIPAFLLVAPRLVAGGERVAEREVPAGGRAVVVVEVVGVAPARSTVGEGGGVVIVARMPSGSDEPARRPKRTQRPSRSGGHRRRGGDQSSVHRDSLPYGRRGRLIPSPVQPRRPTALQHPGREPAPNARDRMQTDPTPELARRLRYLGCRDRADPESGGPVSVATPIGSTPPRPGTAPAGWTGPSILSRTSSSPTTPTRLRRCGAGIPESMSISAGAGDRTGRGATPGGRRPVTVDVEAFLADRGPRVTAVRRLLTATLDRPPVRLLRPPRVGDGPSPGPGRCPPPGLAAAARALRGTDAVVESHQVACSQRRRLPVLHADRAAAQHPPADPRRAGTVRAAGLPARRYGLLQVGVPPGFPWSPSDLVMDGFDLARDIRVLDMRASPYDLRALGYPPVAIETREGKAKYVDAQRGFTVRSQALRRRLLEATEAAPRRQPPDVTRSARLAPVGDAELRVDVAQVVLDGLRAEEQRPPPRAWCGRPRATGRSGAPAASAGPGRAPRAAPSHGGRQLVGGGDGPRPRPEPLERRARYAAPAGRASTRRRARRSRDPYASRVRAARSGPGSRRAGAAPSENQSSRSSSSASRPAARQAAGQRPRPTLALGPARSRRPRRRARRPSRSRPRPAPGPARGRRPRSPRRPAARRATILARARRHPPARPQLEVPQREPRPRSACDAARRAASDTGLAGVGAARSSSPRRASSQASPASDASGRALPGSPASRIASV